MIQEGEFRIRSGKKSVWVPVYKKEDPQNVANHRPVTLLPAIDMIFEQLLCNQLRDKFENIFNNSMSAYRKHYSCEKILIRVVEDWKCERDIDETVAILSTDMSKVFNSMHPKLKLWLFRKRFKFNEILFRQKREQITSRNGD